MCSRQRLFIRFCITEATICVLLFARVFSSSVHQIFLYLVSGQRCSTGFRIYVPYEYFRTFRSSYFPMCSRLLEKERKALDTLVWAERARQPATSDLERPLAQCWSFTEQTTIKLSAAAIPSQLCAITLELSLIAICRRFQEMIVSRNSRKSHPIGDNYVCFCLFVCLLTFKPAFATWGTSGDSESRRLDCSRARGCWFRLCCWHSVNLVESPVVPMGSKHQCAAGSCSKHTVGARWRRFCTQQHRLYPQAELCVLERNFVQLSDFYVWVWIQLRLCETIYNFPL